MATQSVDVPTPAIDKVKVAFAIALVVLGVVGFYWLEDRPTIVRLAALFGGFALAALVAWFSAPGRQLVDFSKDSINESKRVIWPTRKETIQTTAAVFAFVVISALFLWLTDKTLEWVLYDLILGWRR